jgi:hypothetical protein
MNLPDEILIDILTYIPRKIISYSTINKKIFDVINTNKDYLATKVIRTRLADSKFDKIRDSIVVSWREFIVLHTFSEYMYDKPNIYLFNGGYDVLLNMQLNGDLKINSLVMYITALEFKWKSLIELLEPIVEILLKSYYTKLKKDLFDDMLTNDYYKRYDYINHKRNIFDNLSSIIDVIGNDDKDLLYYIYIAYSQINTARTCLLTTQSAIGGLKYSS